MAKPLRTSTGLAALISRLRPRKHELAIFVGGAAVAIAAVTAGLVSAVGGGDTPKRIPATVAPDLQLPSVDDEAGAPTTQADQLPLAYGSFLLVAPGSTIEHDAAYPDERHTWTYANHHASVLTELPADDAVRNPTMPTGYALTGIGYVLGTSPDGARHEIQTLTLEYDDAVHNLIRVYISRPIEFSEGKLYPIMLSPPASPIVTEAGQVGGRPAVLTYTRADHAGGGLQQVVVADGELLIDVESYRGSAFADLVTAARSLLTK